MTLVKHNAMFIREISEGNEKYGFWTNTSP